MISPKDGRTQKKERADKLLVQKGWAESRERAAAYILAGNVYAGQKKIGKPADAIFPDAVLYVKKPDHPYVSRGGVKLKNALTEINIDLSGKTAMDVGASTGGFTDCLLRNGVGKVYAVDCGHNQLDWKLRSHPSVVTLEKYNFRHIPFGVIGETVDVITVDVSFISLKTIKHRLLEFIKPDGDIIMLVKPQFEAGKNGTDKGLVKSDAQRGKILDSVSADFSSHFCIDRLIESTLPGKKKKNIEYFMHITPINAS